MGDVVVGEELFIGSGAADFEFTGAVGMKPEGRAPAIDELAAAEGIVLAGKEVALLPGVLRAGESGGDVSIVTEGGVDACLVDEIDKLGHNLEVFLDRLAGRIEQAGFVVIGGVDLRLLVGLRSGVEEIGGLAEIAELRGGRWGRRRGGFFWFRQACWPENDDSGECERDEDENGFRTAHGAAGLKDGSEE